MQNSTQPVSPVLHEFWKTQVPMASHVASSSHAWSSLLHVPSDVVHWSHALQPPPWASQPSTRVDDELDEPDVLELDVACELLDEVDVVSLLLDVSELPDVVALDEVSVPFDVPVLPDVSVPLPVLELLDVSVPLDVPVLAEVADVSLPLDVPVLAEVPDVSVPLPVVEVPVLPDVPVLPEVSVPPAPVLVEPAVPVVPLVDVSPVVELPVEPVVSVPEPLVSVPVPVDPVVVPPSVVVPVVLPVDIVPVVTDAPIDVVDSVPEVPVDVVDEPDDDGVVVSDPVTLVDDSAVLDPPGAVVEPPCCDVITLLDAPVVSCVENALDEKLATEAEFPSTPPSSLLVAESPLEQPASSGNPARANKTKGRATRRWLIWGTITGPRTLRAPGRRDAHARSSTGGARCTESGADRRAEERAPAGALVPGARVGLGGPHGPPHASQ